MDTAPFSEAVAAARAIAEPRSSPAVDLLPNYSLERRFWGIVVIGVGERCAPTEHFPQSTPVVN